MVDMETGQVTLVVPCSGSLCGGPNEGLFVHNSDGEFFQLDASFRIVNSFHSGIFESVRMCYMPEPYHALVLSSSAQTKAVCCVSGSELWRQSHTKYPLNSVLLHSELDVILASKAGEGKVLMMSPTDGCLVHGITLLDTTEVHSLWPCSNNQIAMLENTAQYRLFSICVVCLKSA